MSKALVKIKQRGAIGKYEPKIVKEIEEAIKSGLSNKKACDLVGIDPNTFYEWIKRHGDFGDIIKKARASKCKKFTGSITAAGIGEVECPHCGEKVPVPKQWQAAAWMLERTEAEEYGQKNMNVNKNINETSEQEPNKVRIVIVHA